MQRSVEMAESTALPPCFRIFFPISEHCGFSLATAALWYSPELRLIRSLSVNPESKRISYIQKLLPLPARVLIILSAAFTTDKYRKKWIKFAFNSIFRFSFQIKWPLYWYMDSRQKFLIWVIIFGRFRISIEKKLFANNYRKFHW